MRRIFVLFLFTVLMTPLFSDDTNTSWDGYALCKITKINVTNGNNYGFRVHTDATDLLDDTLTPHTPISWAYLNEEDSNYKTYVAMLSLAFSLDYSVRLYVKEVLYNAAEETYFAHITYLAVNK